MNEKLPILCAVLEVQNVSNSQTDYCHFWGILYVKVFSF